MLPGSCGGSDDVGCPEVLARLWDFLDRELEARGEDAVREHLDRCQACYPSFDFHRAYHEMVRRCRQESLPPELHARIFRELLSEER